MPVADGDDVEHPLDLRRRMRHPRRPAADGGAVGLDLVVGGGRVRPVDHEDGLAVQVTGLDDRGRRQGVGRRQRHVVDGHAGQRHGGHTVGVGDRAPDDADARAARERSPSRMCSEVKALGRTATSGCSARKAPMARITPPSLPWQ